MFDIHIFIVFFCFRYSHFVWCWFCRIVMSPRNTNTCMDYTTHSRRSSIQREPMLKTFANRFNTYTEKNRRFVGFCSPFLFERKKKVFYSFFLCIYRKRVLSTHFTFISLHICVGFGVVFVQTLCHFQHITLINKYKKAKQRKKSKKTKNLYSFDIFWGWMCYIR